MPLEEILVSLSIRQETYHRRQYQRSHALLTIRNIQKLVKGLEGTAPGVQVERRSVTGTGTSSSGSGIFELKAMGLAASELMWAGIPGNTSREQTS
jgi:hypothetical protein